MFLISQQIYIHITKTDSQASYDYEWWYMHVVHIYVCLDT